MPDSHVYVLEINVKFKNVRVNFCFDSSRKALYRNYATVRIKDTEIYNLFNDCTFKGLMDQIIEFLEEELVFEFKNREKLLKRFKKKCYKEAKKKKVYC